MSIKSQLLFSVALASIIAVPAFAAEGKKMKEVKELVGYNVTETQIHTGPKAQQYKAMDYNKDGSVSLKEYSGFSNLDNEYAAFIRMDKNKDKLLSYDEYANFNNTGKGNTQFESELHGKAPVKGTNLKSRLVEETKTYYVPVEPEIVTIKDVGPAAE